MFNKNKWDKIDLLIYRDEVIKNKKKDNSIIEPIDFNKCLLERKGTLLEGIPFAMKDNFSLEGTITSAASKILRDFKPNYTATIFKKLVEQGAIPIFKTNLDELAMGGTGLSSNYGPVYNPFHKDYIAGGSSSGSNYVVADGTVPFSIGSDTGDSVRKPAAYTGIIGYKPTWGLVSRYGLFDFAPTWDTVGWFTNSVKESAILLDVLQGYDPLDASSLVSTDKDFLKEIELNEEKYKIGVIPDLLKYIQDKEVKDDYLKSIDLLKKDGHEIIEMKPNMEIFESIKIVYTIISSLEAFSCNSNLTGFHFGSYFKKGVGYLEGIGEARNEGFGYEVKKRFLLSQEARYSDKKYYLKAQKIRSLINDEINNLLEKVDVLLIPTTTDLSSDINHINSFKTTNVLNNFLTIFNSNGSPSLSLPITKNGHLSTSVNISSLPFQDKKVLKLANRLEELNGK